MFDGKTEKEILDFVNSVVKNPVLSRSHFLRFFLSCSNSAKFYERRKLEFNNSWLKDVKNKINMMIEEPGHTIEAKTANQSLQEKNSSPGFRLQDPDSEEMKEHMFLEDLSNYCAVNRKIHKNLSTEFQQLGFLLEQVNSKISKVGSLFEKLFSNHQELEKHPVQAIAEIKPSNSRVYSDLKLLFFTMNNKYNQTREELKRIFEPRIGNMIYRSKDYIEVDSLDNRS